MGGAQEAVEAETHRSVKEAFAEPDSCLRYRFRLSAKEYWCIQKEY